MHQYCVNKIQFVFKLATQVANLGDENDYWPWGSALQLGSLMLQWLCIRNTEIYQPVSLMASKMAISTTPMLMQKYGYP